MKKRLYIGIALIFCLDIWFVTYNARDQTSELAADDQRKLTFGESPGITWRNDAIETFGFNDRDPFSRLLSAAQPPSTETRVSVIKSNYEPAVRRNFYRSYNTLISKKEPSGDVRKNLVITYPANHAALKGTEVAASSLTVGYPRAAPKRSIIARALPVIKKPFDVFKMVASKLK